MSDTPEEIRGGEYCEAHCCGTCSECFDRFPNDELHEFSDESLCEECLHAVKRVCVICKTEHAYWCGANTQKGFVCDDCHTSGKVGVFRDLAEPYDEIRDNAAA